MRCYVNLFTIENKFSPRLSAILEELNILTLDSDLKLQLELMK